MDVSHLLNRIYQYRGRNLYEVGMGWSIAVGCQTDGLDKSVNLVFGRLWVSRE